MGMLAAAFTRKCEAKLKVSPGTSTFVQSLSGLQKKSFAICLNEGAKKKWRHDTGHSDIQQNNT
jgi:hypothetical protein